MKMLGDICNCPFCKSDNVYSWGYDEIEFEEYSNSGHAIIQYHCKECNKDYNVSFDFSYNITNNDY